MGNLSSYFDIVKVNEDLYAFSENNIWYKANAFLIIQENEAILIDALSGVYKGFIKNIEEEFNVKINTLYLTHAHYDHFGGSDGRIIKNVYIHENGKKYLTNYPYSNNFIRKEMSHNEESKFPDDFNLEKYEVKKIKNVLTLKDGDEFSFHNLKFKVLLTRGHTKDSACFYELTNKFLFTGDTFYFGEIDIADIDSSLSEYKVTLEKLLSLDVNLYLTGHNKPVINSIEGKEALKNLLKITNSKLKEGKDKLLICI